MHYHYINNKKGHLSQHVANALDLYIKYRVTLYKIVRESDGKFYIDLYDNTMEPQDLEWHYINTRGSNSLGRDIRDADLHGFKFEVICRCDTLEYATLMKKMLTLYYNKKGFEYWEF
jgi:hypothetical protein